MTSGPESTTGRDQEWNRALETAIGWTVRMQEVPDDADLHDEITRWTEREPINAEAWAHAVRVSGLLAQTKDVSSLPTPRSIVGTPPRRRWILPSARALAAVAAAAVIAWVAVPQVILHVSADHITGTGEARTVRLDDGSTVRIGPESAISVAYSSDRRQVRLLSGEAFFDVVTDRSRPFRVEARAASVTVLGTAFDIRLGDSGADVAVKRGRVRVDGANGTPPASAVLTAGQWTRITWDGSARRGEISPTSIGSWSAHRLVVVDRPLGDVIADVRRYHGGAIMLTGNRLRRRSVTGSYDMTDPAAALTAIVQPHGGIVRRITPFLLVISDP
ncbi:FecR family protein [Sphingobium cloacae]|uniref:Uncharacterized protein n=1 Tax=Sphingobium cloacae TaxID=120107 RepID=A0A1E1EYP0_9SPHN|nr:FecR domain-containing protein [Sphingobium cloacae]BAV63378.1 hypothetical protein SCLO_1003380 [Sphingobium cloacae]